MKYRHVKQEQEQEQEQEKEKEKEEEKVDEIEEEEFIRQKYQRDDEEPVPWNINELSHSPYKGQLGFFPLSTFAIFKNYMKENNVLKFPEFLWVSKNHYNLQWTLSRSLRRLKNVIVVMEWQPSINESSAAAGNIRGSFTSMFTSSGLAMGEFTHEQENLLMRCFSMFDLDEDGKLTHNDIEKVGAVCCCSYFPVQSTPFPMCSIILHY